ncbi:STAS/SEC14 domain-containing protein [Bacillus sp. B1-b2]|uniref:STAS/SEC14 domain-containing protein n=1 Tax=Bacillus sp. B1-b2 TaxID=2653201 RepID=UPI001261EA0F|nr:STAS/SEC14 domain-containing protein [Bacillus sp. B1-b2]KAB7672052.1 STAS/SEC14 domain-containing protein [Bacillus sp. B1-b2]
MSANNTSTSISKDIIITNLTGYISIADVGKWFDTFEQTCHLYIKQNKKFKLLVNRKDYTPEHFTVQKLWKDKFFSNDLLNNTIAIAFLLDEGDILDHLNQSNTKENVRFSSDYDYLIDWITSYK